MLTYAQCKELRELLDDSWRDAAEEIDAGSNDFTVCNGHDYRFIHADDIDEIQQEELEADEYILGCFNA